MHIFLLCGLVLCSILAILATDLLKAAISLAGASIFLAMTFFELGAAYAGVFEISVVAGLITVLFIATISLTKGEGEVKERRFGRYLLPVFVVGMAVADFLVMRQFLGALPALPAAPEAADLGTVLWSQRTFDLIGQIAVLLAGVFCVLALFRKRSEDE
ncbi:MAG: NADH-quinone oxidoreductase subunit J [Anaerolineales bacterium]|nr:NADH-quinone oxidoreductase subunit J [Anaerolineales bacterium]